MADPFQYKNTGNPYNQFTEEKLIRKAAVLKEKHRNQKNLNVIIKTAQ